MKTFQLPALQESYTFTVGNNVREQQLEGGMPRNVIKFIGAVHQVTGVVIIDSELMLQYFWAFWRQNQTKEFQWQLITDNGNLETVTCRFNNQQVPNPQLIGGFCWKIQITVYVKSIHRDKDFDDQIIDIWENTDGSNLFEIEKIPNVWLPDAVGVE